MCTQRLNGRSCCVDKDITKKWINDCLSNDFFTNPSTVGKGYRIFRIYHHRLWISTRSARVNISVIDVGQRSRSIIYVRMESNASAADDWPKGAIIARASTARRLIVA